MRLCIALDMPTKEENLSLAHAIKHHFPKHDIWFKVGLRSFIRDGKGFVRMLQDLGFRIFLDLKIYDIPNTMLDSIKECENLGIDMTTIHASSGFKAMKTLATHLQSSHSNLLIVAVSALTSFDEEEFMQVYNISLESGVRNLANLVYQSGLHGVVCSIHEVEMIKQISDSLLTITPGIRLQTSNDDQKRTASVKDAKRLGSDFIVIGRPIYHAQDKKHVLEKILSDMQDSL